MKSLTYCTVATILFAGVVILLNTPSKTEKNTPIKEETIQITEEVSTPVTLRLTKAKEESPLSVFNTETLAKYDGEDASLPIYIAHEGNVYDVTAGAKFYAPGRSYHFLAGTDGTTLLKVMGGSIIKEKYPIVGTFQE